jgi:exopolyphosphatase/guanosine-5'-triphosphate,3'-diphosphate pyrophosphatase
LADGARNAYIAIEKSLRREEDRAARWSFIVSSIATTGAYRVANPSPPAEKAGSGSRDGFAAPPTYAALDLGTNNCRLLVARPAREGFRIVDAFSRIVRLGEGMAHSGRLGEAAIERTLAALSVCRTKMDARGVTRARLIATEACRIACNGSEFVGRAAAETGLDLEIVDQETEAHLAAAGCAALADPLACGVVLFDIGGGSSEIVWLARGDERRMRERIKVWTSLRLGVVTLAEKFGGREVTPEIFQAMVDHVAGELGDFAARTQDVARCDRFHLLGTSGTVTTLAGVHLRLARYDRRRVDGLWMSDEEVEEAMDYLRAMSYEARAANGCIGPERADLVLAGCAIFEAIRKTFPSRRIRIADRGLREGILMQLMRADGVWGGQSTPAAAS